MISGEVKGGDEAARAFGEMARELPQAAMRGVHAAALFVATSAKEDFFRSQGEQTGTKIVKSGWAAGQEIGDFGALGAPIPGMLTARHGGAGLQGSIQVIDHPGRLSAAIGPAAKYGAIHEFGGTILPRAGKYLRFKGWRGWATVTKVVMPARPFMRPALKKQKDTGVIARTVAEALGIAVRSVCVRFGHHSGGVAQ